MPDTLTRNLSAHNDALPDDAILHIVLDPNGTPLDRKITGANLKNLEFNSQHRLKSASDEFRQFPSESGFLFYDTQLETSFPPGDISTHAQAPIHSSKGAGGTSPDEVLVLESYNSNFVFDPRNGQGTRIRFLSESSSTIQVRQAEIDTFWVEVTHASRKVAQTFNLYDYSSTTVPREVLRLQVDGTKALISFLGAAAAGQQSNIADAVTSHTLADASETVDRSEIEGMLNALGTKINSLISLVETFGLAASS